MGWKKGCILVLTCYEGNGAKCLRKIMGSEGEGVRIKSTVQ